MPTSTVEDYLKCILQAELQEPGVRVGTGQIAAVLSLAPASVTSMIKALADGGLVSYEPYSGVSLTPAGWQLAAHVLRRHRLVELFLVRIMGMDWAEVHADAELLEHAVSERFLQRIDEMLGYPRFDPHGDPIPSPEGTLPEQQQETLLTCPVGQLQRVSRIADQGVDFLQLIEKKGLMPGSRLQVSKRSADGSRLQVERQGAESVAIDQKSAAKIFVVPGE